MAGALPQASLYFPLPGSQYITGYRDNIPEKEEETISVINWDDSII